MLYQKPVLKISQLTLWALLGAMFLFYSCMPQATAPRIDEGNSTADGGTTTTTPTYQEPSFPLSGIFVQEGAVRTNTNFSVPVEFNDSFLIRGDALSKYLRTIPNSTKFCLVGKYNYVSQKEKFLVMSAKPKSYTDLISKTTEFYLQVEPANDTANQNDCLSYNLTNTLFATTTPPSVPSVYFSLSQLCTDCTTSVTSSGLHLYFINGEEVPNLPVSSLQMTLSGSSTSSSNGCVDSSACKARGFDCCLQSQCVNDGALKPGALSLPGFEAAQEDVRLNPNRFVVYPQYYFVCESRPETDGSPGGGTTTDPEYEAAIRNMEFKQLYDCINKVDGEFSYCTLKYPNANASMPGTFSAGTDGYNDDINFSTVNPNLAIGDRGNNIVRIAYAGQTVYQENESKASGVTFVTGSANDNLTSSQSVTLNLPFPANAKDANLYITYKVDGTCEKVSSTLSKCTKTYIQGSSDTSSTMWHDSSKIFKLPSYADTSSSANLIVKVSGVVVPEDSTTWSKSTSPNRVIFSSSYNLYQNQSVEITYFVTSSAASLIKLKTAAQEKVNSMCSCASGSKCNLKPVMDSDNSAIVNYECTYPTSGTNTPPANQTVYVSNKNIAHRYFDSNGVNYDEDYGSALNQELTAFSYTNNDVLKPNNVSSYVGFNEIYGSFAKSGTYVSRPAKMVKVKKDQQYDILVGSGSFSSCATCGSDYYSSLQKVFPQNFSGQGGGYTPNFYETSRQNNSSIYRVDDLLFGRSCFVPATMIPWTHYTASLPRDQRRARLQAQHFLFANGYNRDWYGFDYGSLIGSFDGVTWFSIGNQRRIKATSSKLFLAVNAYLGDLNTDSDFNVLVSETTAFSSDIPDHDTETDGAECQQAHFCSSDNDCFKQLGYDYLCQNVSSITTNWPVFDANASEVVGSNVKTLASLIGGTNGHAKRCVYRGRGAPCLQNLDLASSGNNFSGATTVGMLTCSPNNSCLPLNTTNRFNDSIARFANSPVAQNSADASATKSDTVGLGARIILRPYDYYGTKSIPSGAQVTLNSNKVGSICVPGKDINGAVDNYDLHAKHPNSRTDSSDKLYGVGPASSSSQSIRALNACPATDAAGNSLQLFDLPLGDTTLNMFTITQNMSSNLLNLTPLVNQNIYSSTNGSQITAVGYQRNACLRAPGASCFSDLECAPSSFIATKAKSVGLTSVLNAAEAKFWEEDLVCGNPDFKYVAPGSLNTAFNIKNNKCCREFGKTMTVYTQTNSSTHQWCDEGSSSVKVAGVNTSISSTNRYSRVHTVYDKMTCNRSEVSTGSTKKFALSVSAPNAALRLTQILGQYKTLDALNQRTCCTNHWVRSFATENGGGHAFTKSKMQNIDKAMFKHISWGPDNTSVITPDPDAEFECSPTQFANASCEIKSLTPTEEENYLTWAASLELIGIPQVALKTNDQIYKLVNDSQADISGSKLPLTDSENRQIFLSSNTANADFVDDADADGIDIDDLRYYSGTNYTQMNMPSNGLKKVFSENEFNCCIPSGQEVPDTTTAGQCCTGFAANINGPKRCCLPDFTDLTVYTNRYVSSEGRGLPDSSYDEKTGYIKDPGQVKLIAAQKNLCCSGVAMTGVAISQLPIPLTNGQYNPPDTSNTTRRFNYRTDAVDNNAESGSIGAIFDAGVRWNNHVYCVPASLAPSN